MKLRQAASSKVEGQRCPLCRTAHISYGVCLWCKRVVVASVDVQQPLILGLCQDCLSLAVERLTAADPPKPKAPKLLTTRQVATLLGVRPATVRAWIAAGRLQARVLPGDGRHGGRYRISLSSVESRLPGVGQKRTAGSGED